MVKAGRGGVWGGAEAVAEGAAAEQDAAPDYHTAHVTPPSHHRLTGPERMVITTLDGRGHALDLDQRACGREGRRDAGDIIPLTCTDHGRSQDDAGGRKCAFLLVLTAMRWRGSEFTCLGGRKGRRDADDIILLTCTDQGRSHDDAGGRELLLLLLLTAMR